MYHSAILSKTKTPTFAELAFGASRDEVTYFIQAYNATVAEFAKAFPGKFLPETFKDDRPLMGKNDWDALVEAIRHIQTFLVQHDLDHEAAGL
jgi:hypothetical protein